MRPSDLKTFGSEMQADKRNVATRPMLLSFHKDCVSTIVNNDLSTSGCTIPRIIYRETVREMILPYQA